MRPLELSIGLLAAVVGHLMVVQAFPGSTRLVDLPMVLLVLNGLRGRPVPGMLGGTVIGLVKDVLAASAFGLHGFAGTLLGWASARLAQRLVLQRAVGVFLLGAGAVLLEAVVLLLLSYLVMPDLLLVDPVWLLLRATVTGLLAALLHGTLGRLREAVEQRRFRRVKKLHLE